MSGRHGRARAGSRLLLAAALLLVLSAAPAAHAEQQSVGSRVANVGADALDVLLLRPVGVVVVGIGFGFFVASTPLVAPSLDFSDAWDVFVRAPFDYTARRPLGEF